MTMRPKSLGLLRRGIRQYGREHRLIEAELRCIEERRAQLLLESCQTLDALDRIRRVRRRLLDAYTALASPPPEAPQQDSPLTHRTAVAPVAGTCPNCGGEGMLSGLIFGDYFLDETCALCHGTGVKAVL